MLTQQVNGLLMDKIDLQTQGIGHRDEALRRERNLGELRASLAGKSLPKEAEELISALQTSHANSEAHAKALQDKLTKARAVSLVHVAGRATLTQQNPSLHLPVHPPARPASQGKAARGRSGAGERKCP
ncbi:hypothetical protein K437DRAFT_40568 [Tilletiaria anomala UBC 951]|uniref:Uncharacterized protein n=1 Tax=Tilletiaria anomala (strain ATCC 24038 / CBS 436.72 / UBC 951) TaxID=1037660 RepID=A0A066WHV9_TILAU|nr:uncharacterized protein K437DRAFT_40568 [Tilletiaria anomala UBC 951]KDN52118.1 hypothetical protein K437DRAFT_40568 [Tilletiaria anomala UBC 951]